MLWEKHLSGCYSLKHRATAVYGILYRFSQCLHLKFAATQKKVEITSLSSNQPRTKPKTLLLNCYCHTVYNQGNPDFQPKNTVLKPHTMMTLRITNIYNSYLIMYFSDTLSATLRYSEAQSESCLLLSSSFTLLLFYNFFHFFFFFLSCAHFLYIDGVQVFCSSDCVSLGRAQKRF